MSEIKITNLEPAGSEFFVDNEGYLNDLSEDELNVWGGGSVVISSDVSDISKSEVSDVSDISITKGGQ